MYTCNEVAQGESTIGLVEVSLRRPATMTSRVLGGARGGEVLAGLGREKGGNYGEENVRVCEHL